MAEARKVWIELSDSPMDGTVIVVPEPQALTDCYRMGPRTDPTAFTRVSMVATGSVRWNGDDPVEVYVPEDRLGLWHAEHDVEELT